jgi:hypothetical protein
MKNWFTILLLPLFLIACNSGAEQTTTEESASAEESASSTQSPDSEAFAATYKSEAANGGSSDFARVLMVDNKVVELHYWSENDPEPTQLKILTQEYHDGEEISGITGEALWPGQAQPIVFGLIEDRLNFTYPNDSFQEFFWVE